MYPSTSIASAHGYPPRADARPAQCSTPSPMQTDLNGRLVPFDLQAGAVYALGLTFSDHIRETGERTGKPVVFRKHCRPQPVEQGLLLQPTPTQLSAAIATVDAGLAGWLQQRFGELPVLLDYEVEIGIALLEPVTLQQLQSSASPRYGLFVANDVTARSVQIAGEAAKDKLACWAAAKSFAGFLPVGRQLWLPDQPQLDGFPPLQLQTLVNGEIRQSASSSQIIYSPRQLLQFAAASTPDGCLQANDLVLCGTPAGIGLSIPRWKRRLAALLPPRQRVLAALRANRANPRLLQRGDQVQFSADWLGRGSFRLC